MARTALTLYDYSDRELLHMMLDEADGQGWISAIDLARALAIDSKHPAQHVGTRLGWMRRYGAVERQSKLSMWRPTAMGRALALGDLGSDLATELQKLPSDQLLTLTRTLGNRYRRAGDTAAHLMRREWLFSTHGRKPR